MDHEATAVATTGDKETKAETNKRKRSRKNKEILGEDVTIEDFCIFDGIKCPPVSIIGTRTTSKTWTSFEASFWFYFVKESRCEQEVLQRLTLMCWFHRSLIEYATGNLFDTRKLWADCYKCWDFTSGHVCSSIAEHWFRSFEHVLTGNQVPLLGLLDLALEVNDKRQNVTYETSEFKLSNRTLPALKEFLTNQGFAKVAKAISDYVDHKPRIENLIFSTIEESCYYYVQKVSTVMSKDLWDAAGYDSYDYSILLFLTLLSGRVQVDKLLLEGVPVFSNYVTPESTVGSSKSCFFLVSRKANEGKKHLVLFIDGALVCDCKLFHQFGFWCKHAFSVFDYGGIDFNVSLAVDESYSFTSKKEFESICRRTTEFLHITKNWDWGNKNANHAVVNNSGTVVMSTQLNDRVNTEKRETASQARRAAALKVVTDANGNAELGKMFDEFYEAFCKRKAELARSHKINETSSTGLLNPLPNNRKVMQLAENKSYQYKQ